MQINNIKTRYIQDIEITDTEFKDTMENFKTAVYNMDSEKIRNILELLSTSDSEVLSISNVEGALIASYLCDRYLDKLFEEGKGRYIPIRYNKKG